MAEIYDYNTGNEICVGLQGSSVCDDAWRAAVLVAKERGTPVLLDDDDGSWVIYPDGKYEEVKL